MIVVADTTPLNYLIQIDAASILRDLYGQVLIPNAVIDELKAKGAPSEVSRWVESLPDWIKVSATKPLEAGGVSLGAGESEAIHLAILCHADLILIDDGPAMKLAKMKGLIVRALWAFLRKLRTKDC